MKKAIMDGIYEEVVSRRLERELSHIDKKNKALEDIDPAEAPNVLSNYVAEIVKNRLKTVLDSSDKIQDQIQIVNQVIKTLDAVDWENEQVDEEGKQLLSLLNENPINKVVEIKASDLIRPITSIAQSSLFTGAPREPSMSSEINKEIASSDRIDMMVSFIRWSGVDLIVNELRRFTHNGNKLRVITTSYMGATELRAVEELSKLPNTEIKVSYDSERTRLHAKVYVFHRNTGYSTAYIGSSNLTSPAMTSGCEWNMKVTKKELPDVFSKIEGSFEAYWNSKDYDLYTQENKEQLKEALERSGKKQSDEEKRSFFFDLKPYPYQQEILDRLETERLVRNSYYNLICAATGTGKTLISAFDYKRISELLNRKPRLLFVAHRREILIQSRECFREVLKDSEFGDLFYNHKNPKQIDYLFASVSILNRRNIKELPDDYYDYIVVDECHHLAAQSYIDIFEHFKPHYFVGLTATPERMDGKSILPYFNNRLAAEIRLPEAINRKLLCPFHYFGVGDSVDLSQLKWARGGYDERELENVFVFSNEIAKRRAHLIVDSTYKYIANLEEMKGLAFCVSVEHANFMSKHFNDAGIPSVSLSSNSPDECRKKAIDQLKAGIIKLICVVNLYNEGVDIPPINTVLFLRPTESLTVFQQQLGRGLRLSEGKDCLTVLDFVGQANKKYSFSEKYLSLLQRSNQGLKKEIETGFPHIPRGCYIKLEQKAEEVILQNIRDSINTKAAIIQKISDFYNDDLIEHSFSKLREQCGIIPDMVYVKKITISEIIHNTHDSNEREMWKKLYRLSSINSPEFLHYMLKSLKQIESIQFENLSLREKLLWRMLYATFIDGKKPENDKDVLQTLKDYWKNNIKYLDEALSVMEFSLENVDHIEMPSLLPYENTLNVYSTYTRAQALASLNYWNTSSEGRTRIPEKKTTCLFVTLNKGNSYYSPATAYHDYSINEYLFHWQSQNATSPKTSVGKLLINHKEKNEQILLFVREQKDGKYGSVPFVFLGKVDFMSNKGEKPMNVVWRLENKIPANFIDVTDKLGIS